MPLRAERDLALVGSITALGALAFRFGAMLGQGQLVPIPFVALLVAVVVSGGATAALAAEHPRAAYRLLLPSGGLLLAAAILNGLPLGAPVGAAAALVWAIAFKLNARLRRGLHGRQ